ncbi:hypothetical protein M408DRAFT_69764 [Serendipita vermifera MAFF 305830]|uniref:50S ribosomal protein L35 n=1 Tax=Serendipita vermifera MAFF 305830 TaxID=933852 RepID=A0A0C3AV31_SERVB|nr:hypothetical protein M408DRAFT_69764 [Serendipita vermifera MAFF 305830]
MTSLLLRTAQSLTQKTLRLTPTIQRHVAQHINGSYRSKELLAKTWHSFHAPSMARSFSSTPLLQQYSAKRQKKYKLKTNHAAAARWKALSRRMYKRSKEGKSHFNVKKNSARLNRLGKGAMSVPYHVRHLKKLLPYA